jgi:hypothetical protein
MLDRVNQGPPPTEPVEGRERGLRAWRIDRPASWKEPESVTCGPLKRGPSIEREPRRGVRQSHVIGAKTVPSGVKTVKE